MRKRRRELLVSLQPRVKYKAETTCCTTKPSKEDVVQGYTSNATVYFLLTKLLLTNNKKFRSFGDLEERRQNLQQSSNLRESVSKSIFMRTYHRPMRDGAKRTAVTNGRPNLAKPQIS